MKNIATSGGLPVKGLVGWVKFASLPTGRYCIFPCSADLDNNNEHVHATGFINFWILGIQLSSASCGRQR